MKNALHYSIDRVADELKARGHTVKRADLIESLAKGFGYRTSNAMLADAKRESFKAQANDLSAGFIAHYGIETMVRVSPDPELSVILNPGMHDLNAGTRPDLHSWWARFNQELRARGLPEAGFGLARDYFSEGYTPAEAAETEVLVDNPMAR